MSQFVHSLYCLCSQSGYQEASFLEAPQQFRLLFSEWLAGGGGRDTVIGLVNEAASLELRSVYKLKDPSTTGADKIDFGR